MANALFVCLHNAGRSQMSEALFTRAAEGRHEARSAGTSIQPRRQPVMEKYLEKLLTTIAVSSREAALTVSAP